MKNIITALKRSPKRAASLLVVAFAVMIPAGLLAWGPADRPTYTFEKPADHVTFNSITNNPSHGDERNFVQIRDTSTNAKFGEEVALTPGKEYEVYVFFHNNAASNLNDAEHNYKGVAQNATMRVQMPGSVKAGEKARFTGIVGADNAQPKEVWDEAYGTSASNVALRYVPDSATIYSNGAVDGQKLPSTLLTSGTKLGFNALDGKLPGCNEFAGWVKYRFVVDQPNFSVEKTVSAVGKNAFAKSVNAKAGEQVEYKIQYKNTGTTQQNDVMIKDTLPKGISYVPGTTYAATGKSNGQYEKISDNVTTSGVNLGSFAPNANAYVKFTAKVTDNNSLENCGTNTLVNKATAQTNNGSKDDTANVVVSNDCAPGNISVCDLSTNKIVTINEKDFDSKKHSKNLADCAEKCPIPGKEHLPKNSPDCAYCPVPGKEHLSKDSSDCNETPVELPQTGISGGATIAGIGLVTAGLGYALSSRRIRDMLIGQ
ncbi:TPA: DUF11 domain-containing protein [Candidatus Saccharibacteria bacterium]|nr:MAG: exported protein of unknown function [Candidatus Saccharibacteria bacterium GW2011_GWC2_44_17]OGL33897.1 MAG: hypothetical protein A3E20_04105 [Candidatus Saccharibacteria bacterium RIFCSPHIGHO2_12_FULL_47_16]HBH77732.1 DUF11 domain-containing protein [Candidatus Saccharibacteria bacterium]